MNQFPSILRPPSAVVVISQGEARPLQQSAETRWTSPGIEVLTEPVEAQTAWRISVHAPEVPLRQIALRWRQEIEPGGRLLGDHWERSYGDLEWRGIVPERVMPWYFLLSNGQNTYACGVKTAPASLCYWQVDAQGVTLAMDVRCGGEDVILADRVLHLADVVERYSAEGESPYQTARAFAKALCDRPLLTTQPVYGANDFYYAYCQNTQTGLVRDSHTIADLSPDPANRPYSVVDAGWQWGGDANGAPWQVSNARFPDMAGLAQSIRAAGARPGIWFRPLLTTEAIPSGWALPNDRFSIYREPGWILDPSLPEVLERIAQDVRTFIGWGYELVKHDYTTFDLFGRWGMQMGAEITAGGWRFADRGRTTAEIVRGLYDAIHAAAGNAVIISCNTIGHLTAGVSHLQRIGDDTSGKEWARTRKMGVNTLGFRIPQHNALFAIDADCVGITGQAPWVLNRQWLDLLSRSGTPLFVSIDPGSLDQEKANELRRALERAARPQPLGEPLDWMGTTVPERWKFGEEVVKYDWMEE